MIQLDTSFLIQALVSGSPEAAKLQAWLTYGEDVGISAIAWSEFLCGPLTPDDEGLAQLLFSAPEPFLASDARKAASCSTPLAVVRGAWRIARLLRWRCGAVPTSPRPIRRTSHRFRLKD